MNRFNSFHKRGQITIFIVIGLLLLFSSALLLFIKEQISSADLELEIKESSVTKEFEPVKILVDSCLEQVSLEGLYKVQFGGYLSTQSGDYELTRQRFFHNEFSPSRSDVLDFMQGIPYWLYISGSGDCNDGNCFVNSKMPPLYKDEDTLLGVTSDSSVETQLSRYVEAELPNCLDNFDSLSEVGYDVEVVGDIDVTVDVARQDVYFTLHYPLSATLSGVTQKIDDFVYGADLDLGSMYDLAKDVVYVELLYNVFEKQTVNLIATFSGVDEHKLPPTFAAKGNPSNAVRWMKSDVEEMLKTHVLTSYVPQFQIQGTSNYYERGVPGTLESGNYMLFNLPSSSPSRFTGLSANFAYLDLWPIEFDITGRGISGEIIGPETVSVPLINQVIPARYQFYYDVTYPIFVDIYDPLALNGEGYHLYFAIEVNVRNNNFVNTSSQGQSTFVPVDPLFCNENQKNSGLVTVNVTDGLTGIAVEDVQLKYTCAKTACLMGYTELNETDGVEMSLFESQFPICAGGVLTAEKSGFVSGFKRINTLMDVDQQVDVQVFSKKTVAADARIYPVNKNSQLLPNGAYSNQWEFEAQDQELRVFETALFMLERIPDEVVAEEYSVMFVFNGSSQEAQTLDLIPGTYVVTAIMNMELPNRLYDELIIPSKRECFDAGPFSSDECFDLPEIVFNDSFMTGGVEYLWELSLDELREKDDFTFYAIAVPGNNYEHLTHDDLALIGAYKQYSIDHAALLTPR